MIIFSTPGLPAGVFFAPRDIIALVVVFVVAEFSPVLGIALFNLALFFGGGQVIDVQPGDVVVIAAFDDVPEHEFEVEEVLHRAGYRVAVRPEA